MNALHCPNPKCTHTFSAAELQNAGAVRCPRCGQEFRFRAPTKPKGTLPVGKPPIGLPPGASTPVASSATRLDPPPGKPTQYPWVMPALPPQPVQAMPHPMPSAHPGVPITPPGKYPPAPGQPPVAPKPEKIVHVRGLKGARGRNVWLKVAVTTLILIMFVAGIFYGITILEPNLQFTRPSNTNGGGSGLVFHVRNQRGGDERAFTLNIDKDIWSADKDLRNRLRSLAVFKRADQEADAWFAIAVQDFGFRKPREGELLNGAIDRLRTLYGDTLQINAKLEPAKIAGIDAGRCTFTGRQNVVWWGECYLVAHHGFAYWFFIAAPTIEAAQLQFMELESVGAVAFTTERRGWVEQPPQMEIFASRSNAFVVQVPEKVWRKNDPLTSDENGEMYLSGFFQSLQGKNEEPSLAKNATLLAVSLERVADLKSAFKAAVTYFESKKQEESKDYKFVPMKEGAHLDGEEAFVGNQSGYAGDMRLMRGSEPMRFVKIVIFNDASKTYALRFECGWENEAIWRKEFDDMIKTVRFTKE